MSPTGSGSRPGRRVRRDTGPLRGLILLVDNSSFAICNPDGTIDAGGLGGVYFHDARRIDELSIRFGTLPSSLLSSRSTGYGNLRAWSAFGDPDEPAALLRLDYQLTGNTLQIDLEVRSFDRSASLDGLMVRLREADTDLFEVRGLVEVTGAAAVGRTDSLRLVVDVAGAKRDAAGVVTVRPDVDANPRRATVRISTDAPLPPPLTEVSTTLRASTPELTRAWDASVLDVSALRMRDPDFPHLEHLAAGAPWFMTLFGRDSLIAGMEASLVTPALLFGAVGALALRQGKRVDESRVEAPGKILHELRRGPLATASGGWGAHYYGSADATALFLIALERAWRRGLDRETLRGLVPAAERAVRYLTDSDDVGEAGLLSYRSHRSVLPHQGWKDSPDGIRFADGSIPRGRIALVEVQGYVVRALRAQASLRRALDIDDGADLERAAEQLAGTIVERYWMDGQDTFAVALLNDVEPVDSITSNPGHLLWAEAISGQLADRLSRRLLHDDLMTGFGIRTLGRTQAGFHPFSYHGGSVWPHDTAMTAVGMIRAGRPEGPRLAWSLLDAASSMDGHLPELMAGLDRDGAGGPVPCPTACSPQAWAAAAPISLVEALLGLDVDVPNRRVALRPSLPEDVTVELKNVRLAPGEPPVTVRACGHEGEVLGLHGFDVDPPPGDSHGPIAPPRRA